MIPAFIWPVFGFHNPHRPTVAMFFDYYDAVDFVRANMPERNLYIGEPRYDRRAKGYRPALRLAEVHDLGPGRVAA